MADVSDALDALAALIGAAAYPQGTAAASPVGTDVFVVRGWPLPADLDATLVPKGGTPPGVYVSVFPLPNLTQVTSSALTRWDEIPLPVATVQASADPDQGTVTISGAGSATLGQTVTVLIGGTPFTVGVQAADTPDMIASGLATLIVAAYPDTTSLGPVIRMPSAPSLLARVSRRGKLAAELERERQAFMITIWAPDAALRTAAGKVVRPALAASPRLALADGTVAQLAYRQTTDSDTHEKVAIYRRDIHYWVEFGTFLEVEAYEVTAPFVTVQSLPDPATGP